MPTVLHINSCANWGSTGKIAEQINIAAAAQGWHTYIAYGRIAQLGKSQLIHIGNKFSQLLALLEARLFDNDGLANICATKRLVRKIKTIKPDIIHLHNLHGYYINYRILFKYLNNTDIPIVWTLHDCWAFTGHCGHFVSANCEKWKKECCRCHLKKGYPSSFVLDCSKKNYALKKKLFKANNNIHLVVVSNWLGSMVKQSFFKDTDMVVINNGVDLNIFKPHIIVPNGRFSIIAVSSVWPESKGLAYYSKLSEMIKEDEDLILIGVDESISKKLPSNIICIPRTSTIEELVLWYNKADVVLSLSSAESFGLTIAEGFACGTPGIVFNNAALPELITPSTGFVIEDNNVESLYDKIQTIRKRGKKYYSSSCRERAELYYNKDARYNDYLQLYKLLAKYR